MAKKLRGGEKLFGRISEIFFSIQGEGIYTGLPCWFIRFAGCDKNCFYCDTPYAKKGGTKMTVEAVASRIKDCAPVVITGGEPTLQGEFLGALLLKIKGQKRSRRIFIETSGSRLLAEPGIFEHISFHAELPLSANDKKFIRNISPTPFSLKVVVTDALKFKDLNAAALFLGAYPSSSVVLQPLSVEKKIDKKALAKAIRFARRLQPDYPELRMLPQLHNLLALR